MLFGAKQETSPLFLFLSKVCGKLLRVSLKLKTSQRENVLLLKVAAEEKQQKEGEGLSDKNGL